MDLSPYLEALRRDLAASAAPGGPDIARAADLLGGSLEASARLCLLEALSDAAPPRPSPHRPPDHRLRPGLTVRSSGMYEFDCPRPVTLALRLGGGGADVVAEERTTAVVDVTPDDSSDASREAAANTRVEL